MVDAKSLREEIIRLGPWHYDIEVTPEVSTRVFLEAPESLYPSSFGPVSFLPIRDSFLTTLQRVYPDGLAGRTMLDCACNCGAYLFFAKELGAGMCFGSDVRAHWINQAHFLATHRIGPKDGLTFQVCDLYDLPKLGLQPFDITFFGGIFYHLPDPITGLKVAADLTKDLLIINTATRNNLPDGMLWVEEESREMLLSGVYGLNWYPTGPSVLVRILKWLGFPATRLHWHITDTSQSPDMGRLQLYAARHEETFAMFDGVKR